MTFSYPDYPLLVMSKAPVAGRVKTRMQPHLSQAQSRALHIALAQYAISTWVDAALCPLQLWVGGDQALFKQDILAPLGQSLLTQPQPEGDLGHRMGYAVALAEKQSAKGMILVGTDCPFIDKAYLQMAIDSLEEGNEVVIGPANDGGYVLLGMKHYQESLFNDIAWGGDQVLATTIDRIETLGLRYQQLPALVDIDLVSDLPYLSTLKHPSFVPFIS